MTGENVSKSLIKKALASAKYDRVLPFRFISAAKYAPELELELEAAMFKCLIESEKLSGHTVLLIDVSGSMNASISSKSEINRWEAAAGLAILAREICKSVSIYIFSTSCALIPARHGFALRDAIGQHVGGGTNTGDAIRLINAKEEYDRIIVFTDEQSHQNIDGPTGKGYFVNVASAKNGIGYGKWTHIDGWSESVLKYIYEAEKDDLSINQ
jgi:60 kDa SS-A/Ro ribonucleoprotein